jgi:hypothetical protein
LNTRKATTGGIPYLFYKECAAVTVPTVVKLFRMIVRSAKYPSNWKVARITPPHKRGSVKFPKNYRPISGLNNLSLIFEDTIYPQFEAWIDNFILVENFGFAKGT